MSNNSVSAIYLSSSGALSNFLIAFNMTVEVAGPQTKTFLGSMIQASGPFPESVTVMWNHGIFLIADPVRHRRMSRMSDCLLGPRLEGVHPGLQPSLSALGDSTLLRPP